MKLSHYLCHLELGLKCFFFFLVFNLLGVVKSYSFQSSTFYDSLYLEAEGGEVEAPMQILEDATASNGQYVEVAAGNESTGSPPSMGKVTFQVSLNAGTYKIWGRVITPSEADDSFWVSVDNGNPYRWNGIGTVPSWSWVAVHDSDNSSVVVSWELDAGDHTVEFYYREDGAKLDEIYITRLGDTPTKGDPIVPMSLYVSDELGSDDNNGFTENSPIKTLHKAYQIAHATQDSISDYQILLRGGETYTDFTPLMDEDVNEGGGPSSFAFIWDIDRKLTLSTYGSDEMAHLYGGKHQHEGGPTQGVLVISPSTKDVLIENLFLEMWQKGALMVLETEDVHIRNIKIDKIGTYYFPAEQTPRGDTYPYTAGVVYPKNSTRILIEDIVMTNCHNVFENVTSLHGFYGTRLNQSEIRNCYLRNVSGSPFKFRRSAANNVLVRDNECYYTGHTEFEESWAQPGFLRYSGDSGGDCPFALTFENNIFHYPFCWSEYGEDCDNSEAILCSVSNTGSCGEDACIDPEKVNWIDNEIIYAWQPGSIDEVPMAPFNFSGVSVSESSVLLTWFETNLNENAYVVERKINGAFEQVARLAPNSKSYTDTDLTSATSYEYRVYAENKLGNSDYSAEISVTTEIPNRAPIVEFSASRIQGMAPLEVFFDASASSDPDGDGLIYAWLVDDKFSGNKETLSFLFEEVGTYTVTLLLEDGQASAEKSIEITVEKPLSTPAPDEDLIVYPNPTSGKFHINTPFSDFTMHVYNMSGQHVKSESIVDKASATYFLPKGVYFLRFSNSNSKSMQRKLLIK